VCRCPITWRCWGWTQIKSASISTSADGLVHDVFSVEVDTEYGEREQEVVKQILEKLKSLIVIETGEPDEKRVKLE
jgi:hypothetical protein